MVKKMSKTLSKKEALKEIDRIINIIHSESEAAGIILEPVKSSAEMDKYLEETESELKKAAQEEEKEEKEKAKKYREEYETKKRYKEYLRNEKRKNKNG